MANFPLTLKKKDSELKLTIGPFKESQVITDIETKLMMHPENSGHNDDIKVFYRGKMLESGNTCRHYNLNRLSELEYANVDEHQPDEVAGQEEAQA